MNDTDTSMLLSAGDSGIGRQLEERLWELTKKQMRRYTLGDSSSIPIETAEELFTTVCWLISAYATDRRIAPTDLIMQDADELLKAAQDDARRKLQLTKRLLRAAEAGVTGAECDAYTETLLGIKRFIKAYDPLLSAHVRPADIDYLLCFPISERLYGADYANAYLCALLIENDFLRRVDPKTLSAILERNCCKYKQTVANMYEPTAANALGLAALGKNPLLLQISDADREKLSAAIDERGAAGLLADAALRLSDRMEIGEGAPRLYIKRAAEAIVPRAETAYLNGSLKGVFVSI